MKEGYFKFVLIFILSCILMMGCVNSNTSTTSLSNSTNSTVSQLNTNETIENATENETTNSMSNEILSTNETSQENATAENATTIKLNPNSFVMALNSTDPNFSLTPASGSFLFTNGSDAWAVLSFYDNLNNRREAVIARINEETREVKTAVSLGPFIGTVSFTTRIKFASSLNRYILYLFASFCANSTCSSYKSAKCIFNMDLNNVIKWSRCYSYPDFSQEFIWNGKIYLISSIAGSYVGEPNFVVLDGDTGEIIVSKRIIYNNTNTSLNSIYVDSSGIYIGGGGSYKQFLLKLDHNYNLVYIKEIGYNSTVYYSIKKLFADENYLYIIAATHSYELWKIDKQTGEAVFVKTILHNCPGNCYEIKDGLIDNDALYFVASFNYWGGEGSYVFKLDKDGNLIWATNIKYCDTYECTEVLTNVSDGPDNTITLLGGMNKEDKKFSYLITLDKETGLMPGYEDHISNATADDIGYEEENYEDVYIKDMDFSLFSFEDVYPAEIQPYPYYEENDVSSLVNATILFPSEEGSEE